MMRGMRGSLLNSIDRDLLEFAFTSVADDSGAATYHINLAADALTDTDINDAEAAIREQDGIANTNSGFVWIANPRWMASAKSVAEYIPSIPGAQQGELGIPMVGSINGIPAFAHNACPGSVNGLRHQAATTAVTVASNVATATVASGHGFVPGQQIWTSDLTTNVAVGSPATITSVTATTIVYPLTAADGALADGVGTIYSASSYGLLIYAPWMFYALDGEVPFVDMVKREGTAGWTTQLFHHLGRQAHAGSVYVVHAPD